MANKGNLITFPPGIAVYPAVNRPDTKFDELGNYKADVKLPMEKAKKFIDQLSNVWKSHTGKPLKKSDNPLFYMEVDDDGEETGNVVFKCRVKNKTTKAGKLWDRRPMLIDAKKNDFPVDTAVWGGTTYRVQVEVYEWIAGTKKGVSLQPVVVQIIDLVTGGGKADTSAFDEEDGFEADEDETKGDTSGFDDEDGGDDASDDADY